MRIILIAVGLSFVLLTKAQVGLPLSSLNFSNWRPFSGYGRVNDSSQADRKWQVNSFSSVSAGALFFNGGSATFLSVPVGLQITRQLSNNLYAFGTLSAAPTAISFSRSFTDPYLNTNYPGQFLPNTYANPYKLGVNAAFEMGLMYVNDARTFSISGSIGIERSSYPFFPVENRNIKNQQKP